MACTKHASFKYLVDIGKRTDYFLHFLEEDRTIVKKERFRLLWWNLCQHLLAYLWEARRKMQKFFRRISSPIFQRAAVVSPYLFFLALKKEHHQNINLCFPMFCLLFGKMIHILDKNGDLPYTICHAWITKADFFYSGTWFIRSFWVTILSSCLSSKWGLLKITFSSYKQL